MPCFRPRTEKGESSSMLRHLLSFFIECVFRARMAEGRVTCKCLENFLVKFEELFSFVILFIVVLTI
jgi:hypothetical protein